MKSSIGNPYYGTGTPYYGGTSDPVTTIDREPKYEGLLSDEAFAPPQPRGAIPEAMQVLTEEISLLNKVLDELQSKIMPVCRPEPEKLGECEKDNVKIQSLLGLGIENQTHRIIALRKKVQELLTVIEL
jgi:hypothetical protein